MYDQSWTSQSWAWGHHWLGDTFWLAVAFSLALYFLPTIIGRMRDMAAGGALFIVNLLFGWTMLGWVLCLIWGFVGATRQQRAWSYGPPPGWQPPPPGWRP